MAPMPAKMKPTVPVGQLLTHLSHVKTTPKWSFAERASRIPWTTTPGPGSYEFRSKLGEAPQYSVPKRSCDNENACAVGSETSATTDVPGPGSYECVDMPSSQRMPKWGFTCADGGRTCHEKEQAPGPGRYNFRSTVGDGPQYSHRRRAHDWNDAKGTDKPGPGNYQHADRPDAPSMPKWGFGSANGKHGDRDVPRCPGPGSYDFRSTVGNGVKYTTAGPKVFSSSSTNVPGPGEYDHGDRPDVRSTPRYGFGSASRDGHEAAQAPGPGAYNMNSTVGRGGPKYTARGKGRDALCAPLETEDISPAKAACRTGPGDYDHRERPDAPSTPGWSFGHVKAEQPRFNSAGPRLRSTNDQDRTTRAHSSHAAEGSKGSSNANRTFSRFDKGSAQSVTPGPGAYEVKDQPDSKKLPQWSFGPGAAQTLQKKGGSSRPDTVLAKSSAERKCQTPGPADYQTGDRPDSHRMPTWGFGAATRDCNGAGVSRSPGPAAYVSKGDMGNGPKYSARHHNSSLEKHTLRDSGIAGQYTQFGY